MDRSHYRYSIDFKVRDYECDIQGIVNNSVYMNYLEHARHEFLADHGLDFHTLCQRNINLVVTRAETDYFAPLKSGDTFWVGLSLDKTSKIRGVFTQDIYRSRDNKKMLSAKISWASINEKHKPFYCEDLEPLFVTLAD